MTNQDIPLSAIRAFVSIGRHGNFTRAAKALGVTQGAVSRHVATLEALADCRLFERKGSTIAFTSAGLQFYEAVKDAMSTVELATQQIAQRGRRHDRLRIRTSMPSFALTVVVPALGAFTAGSAIEVDLITSLSPPQPHDEFDVLITRDLTLDGTESWVLLQEELVCVGSPTMVNTHKAKASHRWSLIAARSRLDIVATWAESKQIAPDRMHVGAMYDHLFLAIAAAIGGTGLLVVPRLFVLDQLQQGTLVLADDEKIATCATYTAYVNPQSDHVQAAREFCRWLKGMLRGMLQKRARDV